MPPKMTTKAVLANTILEYITTKPDYYANIVHVVSQKFKILKSRAAEEVQTILFQLLRESRVKRIEKKFHINTNTNDPSTKAEEASNPFGTLPSRRALTVRQHIPAGQKRNNAKTLQVRGCSKGIIKAKSKKNVSPAVKNAVLFHVPTKDIPGTDKARSRITRPIVMRNSKTQILTPALSKKLHAAKERTDSTSRNLNRALVKRSTGYQIIGNSFK